MGINFLYRRDCETVTMHISNYDINFMDSQQSTNDKIVYAFYIKATMFPPVMPDVCELCCIS